MAVTSRDRDDASPEEPPVAWHNRTSTLLGASVAGLAAIAVLIGLLSYVAGQFNEPEQPPLYYVPPAVTASKSGTSTPTTTSTITSTSPPMTTDINPDATPSSTSESTTSPSTRPPRTRETETSTENDDDDEPQTTRSRPRTNVTRTLYPGT
ncbi:Uncharacterised protein [Mycolicibacterium aurum]|uniref:Uncharacterized protein n=1 Tax=Mycolicibacterium aurum TaxID=1791 RepID=A0A3S4VMY9_MYCAU|nr:Uncharacterised protein [Mycolicibacterium aurum]